MEPICPHCNKTLASWLSIRKHLSKCKSNTHTYTTDDTYGPIHYSEFMNITDSGILAKYPSIRPIKDIKSTFAKNGIKLTSTNDINPAIYYTKEDIICQIKEFVTKYKKIPQTRDFEPSLGFISYTTVKTRFGSWNEAIKAAGYEPNENDGFGTRTKALDGVLYRSNYETMFVNKFLFDKEEYIYELKYPIHNKYYDFYLPERDLYIEIDGGCRPTIMEEKIKINKELGRNLLVIKGSEIAAFKGF